MTDVNRVFFGVKYIFRLIHMVSFAFVFGNVSYDLFMAKRTANLEKEDSLRKTYVGLTITFSVLLIISGLINMILLLIEKKFAKDSNYNFWKKSLIAKFLITILLTPILERLISIGVTEENQIESIALPVRFAIMLILTLFSPFLRFFREYYMKTETELYIK
jgi:hypothetical protein